MSNSLFTFASDSKSSPDGWNSKELVLDPNDPAALRICALLSEGPAYVALRETLAHNVARAATTAPQIFNIVFPLGDDLPHRPEVIPMCLSRYTY